MPLYDYKCQKCSHIFEVMQKITEEPLKFCPQCKGTIKRLISAAGIIFKGSGFHVNDYGKKSCLLAGREVKESKKSTPTKPAADKSKSKEVSK